MHTLSNIKRANLNQFLDNILLFLIFMCVKMYYFNTNIHVIKETTTSNQFISALISN